MTTMAKSASPPNAVRMWTDGLVIYTEIPGTPPYIAKFSLTEGGLSKALDLLRTKAKFNPNGHPAPKTREPTRVEKRPEVTDEQRATAVAVLRKLGMV